MKNFSNFLNEAMETEQGTKSSAGSPRKVSDTVVASFGRFNPIHKGHERALRYAKDLAGKDGADTRFYASKSYDDKKNPLDYKTKLADAQKQFPDFANDWDDDDEVRTILDVAKKAHKDGYKNFKFVGGEDRREAMENLLRRYNGQEDMYNFDNIESHSAGAREDKDGNDPTANFSASSQRKFAADDDFDSYSKAINFHDGYTEDDARAVFKILQSRLAKKEDLELISDKEYISEQYRQGNLYKEGDIVESLATGLVGKIHRCGANHLICVTENGIMFKSFVHDVQAV